VSLNLLIKSCLHFGLEYLFPGFSGFLNLLLMVHPLLHRAFCLFLVCSGVIMSHKLFAYYCYDRISFGSSSVGLVFLGLEHLGHDVILHHFLTIHLSFHLLSKLYFLLSVSFSYLFQFCFLVCLKLLISFLRLLCLPLYLAALF